jgi:hypothetical protein
MDRIELSPGEQTAFRTIEELAVAIRRGVVTPQARIWHHASSKWLPITYHPHYNVAASMQLTSADLAAGPPVKPLELLTLGELVDPPSPPIPAEPKPALRARQPLAPRQPVSSFTPLPEPAPKPRKRAAKPRRSNGGRRPLRLALAGAVLIASVHLAFNAVNSSASEEVVMRPKTHRRLVAAPPALASQDGRAETTAAAVLPGLPSLPSSTMSPTLPRESAYAATPGDSASPIQPAPTAIELIAPRAVNTDSMAPRLVDTTSKKAMKGVLRAIGGTSTPERARPKR